MRTAGQIARLAGIALAVLGLTASAQAYIQVWQVTQGVTSLTIGDAQLGSVGLALGRVAATAPEDAIGLAATAPGRRSFAIPEVGDASFRTREGAFTGFTGVVKFAVRGGLQLRVIDSRMHVDAAQLSLDGFVVELAPRDHLLGTIRPSGDGQSPFLEIRNAGFALDPATGDLLVPGADLVLAPAWASAAGRPELASEWVGTFDLRLRNWPTRQEREGPTEPRGPTANGIDVLLAECYGMNDLGRLGTYPNGTLGLSFNTTSCNNGSVNVPWHAPMAEDHPFMGLVMFREMNGRMEMIGRGWIKHGFYALANNQCNLGCGGGGGGGYLYVGCSDTYSISNNGSQYYLGPREEVNPYTCVWHCLGSWFDGNPVDCVRSNDGSGLDGVAHRIEVHEDDLALPGATYYYEGVYYVMDDVNPINNFMWRTVVPSWTGSGWNFTDVGGGATGPQGPLLLTAWGDVRDRKQVSSTDGYAILAEKTTDLGGGMWHYEYALYNETSDRGIERFSIPIGTANVSNVGFRDIDRDAGNQWTFTAAGGLATWTTNPFGSANPVNPILYEMLFNFWFDADAAPVISQGRLKLFKPGTGDYFFLNTRAPYSGTTAALDPNAPSGPRLFPVEPNPFARSTSVAFALPSSGPVRLSVVDVGGRLVKTLLIDTAPAGRTALSWNGRDDAGSEVASGIYFFRLEAAKEVRTTKGILLR